MATETTLSLASAGYSHCIWGYRCGFEESEDVFEKIPAYGDKLFAALQMAVIPGTTSILQAVDI